MHVQAAAVMAAKAGSRQQVAVQSTLVHTTTITNPAPRRLPTTSAQLKWRASRSRLLHPMLPLPGGLLRQALGLQPGEEQHPQVQVMCRASAMPMSSRRVQAARPSRGPRARRRGRLTSARRRSSVGHRSEPRVPSSSATGVRLRQRRTNGPDLRSRLAHLAPGQRRALIQAARGRTHPAGRVPCSRAHTSLQVRCSSSRCSERGGGQPHRATTPAAAGGRHGRGLMMMRLLRLALEPHHQPRVTPGLCRSCHQMRTCCSKPLRPLQAAQRKTVQKRLALCA